MDSLLIMYTFTKKNFKTYQNKHKHILHNQILFVNNGSAVRGNYTLFIGLDRFGLQASILIDISTLTK